MYHILKWIANTLHFGSQECAVTPKIPTAFCVKQKHL